eukprot:7386640-Prymnesium_polylepis.1
MGLNVCTPRELARMVLGGCARGYASACISESISDCSDAMPSVNSPSRASWSSARPPHAAPARTPASGVGSAAGRSWLTRRLHS